MVTLIKYGALSGGEKYNVNVLSIDGLSTDTKPTVTYIEYGSDGREVGRMGIPNGSIFTEIDTGDTYMYDVDNTTWYQVTIGGGGGTPQGGIILVGETTTALTDNATTNPITINGSSYTAQPNDAVIYGNKEFLFDGTKWHEFGDLSGLSSKDIGSMTNYVIAQTGAAINTSDTLNQAMGKVEKRVSDNETNILLKANTSDVNAATANLQAQIDNIITPVTQDAEVENARVNRNGVPHTTLKERIDDDEYETQKISDAIPHTLDIEQKTINNVGVISDNNTRTLTAVTYVKSGDMLSVETGYSFRYATYTRTGNEFNFSEMDSTWRNSLTFNNAGYKRIAFKKNDDSNLTPDDTVKIISSSSTINFPVKYTIGDDIEQLSDDMSELKRSDMNLLMPFTGKDNMMWSYALSLYPLCQHFKRVRNCVYWGYTTHEGYSGIACYNLDDKTLKKTHLKKSDIDDHNPCAIFVRDNGEIIVSYSGGHNTDTYIHIRKSITPECIDFFDDDRSINVDYYSTYSQIFEYNNKIWIFFRYDNTSWGCITSTDGGATWSTRQAIIFANVQYYCKFQKTTTDGLIRMCMYSNPDQTEKDIRMGFLDLSTGKIYNADNTTEIGSVGTAVRWENFTVVISAPDTGKQRLFDVAVTAPNITSILIARWTTYVDGIYKWYNNGNLVDICNCGAALYTDKYQGGAAFVSNTEIVVSRSWDGNDYIELWDLSSTPTKDKEIYHEEKGTIPIRNCRPIVSPDGKSLLWHRGYFNANDYTDFNSEAKLYMIDNDTII